MGNFIGLRIGIRTLSPSDPGLWSSSSAQDANLHAKKLTERARSRNRGVSEVAEKSLTIFC